MFIRAQKAEFFGRTAQFRDDVERFLLSYVALKLDKSERFHSAATKTFYLRNVQPRPRESRHRQQ